MSSAGAVNGTTGSTAACDLGERGVAVKATSFGPVSVTASTRGWMRVLLSAVVMSTAMAVTPAMSMKSKSAMLQMSLFSNIMEVVLEGLYPCRGQCGWQSGERWAW